MLFFSFYTDIYNETSERFRSILFTHLFYYFIDSVAHLTLDGLTCGTVSKKKHS